MPEISEPQKLDFDAGVDELDIRIVNGAVNVVGTDEDGARVEIAEVHGPPLLVRREGSRIVVEYEDLPWKGFLKRLDSRLLDSRSWKREAVVTVSVPADSRLTVGVVGASAVVSGIRGRTAVRGVSGGTTLVGLSGDVRADTVSGNVETQALRGALRMNSVAGDLTVIDGGASSVRADTVSGDMIVDLDHAAKGAEIVLNTVSGEIAVRLPDPADADVEASTAGGAVSSAFDELRVDGHWGAKRLTGRLGNGTGRLRATTVSGAVALLRRPPGVDGPDGPHTSLRKDV